MRFASAVAESSRRTAPHPIARSPSRATKKLPWPSSRCSALRLGPNRCSGGYNSLSEASNAAISLRASAESNRSARIEMSLGWSTRSLWLRLRFTACQCQRLLELHVASLLPASLRLVLAKLRSRLSTRVPFQHAPEARRRTAADPIPQGFRRAHELQCFLGTSLPHRQEGQVPERQPDPRRVAGLAEQTERLQRRRPGLARAAGATTREGKPDQIEGQLKTVAQAAPDRDNFFESRDRARPVAGLSIADHKHREGPGDPMLDFRGPEQVEALLEQVG